MIRNVIFDLDGTLADTSPGIIESVQHTVQTMGLPALSEAQLRAFIGPPLRHSFAEQCGCTPQEAQQAVTVFRAHYQDGAVFHAALYPGIAELCAELKASGFRMAVATNKPDRFASALVRRFGLDGLLDPVCGADEEGRLKKADLIRMCMNGMQASCEETVLIGDTENDAEGAEQAGVQFLAVTYGFGFRSAADTAAKLAADTPLMIAEILLRKKEMKRTVQPK